MGIYSTQRRYFAEAYRQGEHGWPVEGPSAPLVRFLQRYQKTHPSGTVLDLGCGEGRHTFLFAEKGYRAFGVDYQRQAVDRARSIGRQRGWATDGRFLLADLFHLPFQKGSVDILVDYGCLHHVKKSDFPRYLNAVVPLIVPGGHYLLSCFSIRFRHYPGERRRRDWLVHRGHYDRFFRKSDFQRLFGRDFDIRSVEEERAGLNAFFYVWMRKKAA